MVRCLVFLLRSQGHEVGLDLGAKFFITAGQLERLSEMRSVLISIETRLVGGDLEQDARPVSGNRSPRSSRGR